MLWISIDPGDVTGMFIVRGNEIMLTYEPVAREGPAFDIVQGVYNMLSKLANTDVHVVLEGVTLPNKTHLPQKTFGQAGVIDAVQLYCLMYGAELIVQDPGQRKIITNEMLKKLNWYIPSPDKHMIDAAKHMVVAMLKKKLLKMEDLV